MIRYPFLLMLAQLATAWAQPETIVEDLQQRSLAAIRNLQRAENWDQVLDSRKRIRARIEQSLNLNQKESATAGVAFLYAPNSLVTPAPAVVLVRPHTDLTAAQAQLLPSALAQRGFFVLELDARAHHSRMDSLVAGTLPQSLIQGDVQAALVYLKARPDVDPKRLAIAGDGFAVTVAAAIHSDFTAVVLVDGAPDFTELIPQLRSLPPDQFPDSCNLLPGILQYAGSEELLSLIAPRPLLLVQAAAGPLQYAREVYRWSGSGEKISYLDGDGSTAAARYSTYAWLARWVQDKSSLRDFQEPRESAAPVRVELARFGGQEPRVARSRVTEQALTNLLGSPLSAGSMSFGLNCNRDHRVDFYPQSGIRIPVTVKRPGPNGCDVPRGTLVAVDDRGRGSLADDEIVLEASRRGWIVWRLDPRCVGELKTNAESFVFATSLLLGENVTWRQAWDILLTLRELREAAPREPILLYARGKNMGLAASYIAAIADPRELDRVILRDTALTLSGMSDVPLWVLPFGALRTFDIQDLWDLAKAKIVRIRDAQEFMQLEW